MRQEATGIPEEKEKWWTHRDHNLFVNSGRPELCFEREWLGLSDYLDEGMKERET